MSKPYNFLDDPELHRKYAREIAELEAERQQVQDELADCERLTEADLVPLIVLRQKQ